MKALTYHGPHHVQVENVPDPGIEQADDIILRITATAICGSDLHLYRGKIPQVKHGDIFGHEFMGEVIETGKDVKNLQKGDRVVIPFVIACGDCFFCRMQQYAACENTNAGKGAALNKKQIPAPAAVMDTISRYMSARQLQQIAGVGAFAFNTLYKLIWLKENHPQLLAQAHAWLFISSLINHRLTGEFTTDLTMAGTSQMLDLRQRDFSAPILQATGLPRRLFPQLVEAGQPIGALLPEAAALLGLPVGVPVISAGHDTQFALFGAGAGQDEPVLSSGTWEILMVRSAQVDTSLLCDYSGSTCELDSQPGRYNPGMQWLASGVLEWVRKLLWNTDTPWQTLIDEAQAIPPGAQGVRMQCDLLASQHAGWQGVTLNTTRGHFYRAALEGLSDQLAKHLQTLENIGRFRAQELLLVGGGSRNALWNQIKADRLGIPIKVLDDAETTVAGAAMFGWYGVGEFSSPEQARAQVAYRYRYFWPQTEPELTEEA